MVILFIFDMKMSDIVPAANSRSGGASKKLKAPLAVIQAQMFLEISSSYIKNALK